MSPAIEAASRPGGVIAASWRAEGGAGGDGDGAGRHSRTTAERIKARPGGTRRCLDRRWQTVAVRLAVALAFADASIVVLALPEIVVRLHTSISHVTWVIMAYNLALIVAATAIIPFAGRATSPRALIAGLALFGLASIGCGLSGSMSALVPFRCLQGLGGGLLLCASLPVLAGAARSGKPTVGGWSAAAAIGMAVGPAAGGILTQIFDWRSIFLAQAPVALLAVVLVGATHVRSGSRAVSKPESAKQRGSRPEPVTANAALALLSAGLIGALFLVVLALIDVWLLTPIAAAGVVSTIPIMTAILQRVAGGRSPVVSSVVGAALVAAGLLGLSLLTHRELGGAILALALTGSGLGLAFPPLTAAALHGAGPAAGRAAKTVAARDAGIIVGLLILTPVFVDQLNTAPDVALPAGSDAVLSAPVPVAIKSSLARNLLADYKKTPQGELPDFGPTFAEAGTHATLSQRAALRDLHRQLDSIVQRATTQAFRLPLRYCAIFAILVLPLLSLRPLHGKWTRRRLRARWL